MSSPAHRDRVLLRQYHEQGDRYARELLVERGMPLVHSIVRRYQHSGEPIDDLVQVGALGLVKAIDGFDLRFSTTFVSYAAPNISGELKRHFRDHAWTMHVSRGMQELNARVRHAQRHLESSTGGSATPEAIAARLGETRERVLDAQAVTFAHRAQPMDALSPQNRALVSLLGRDDRALELVDARDLIRRCAVGLDERQRKVVWMRYFQDMLQREIAVEIGVSQMQVSRLLTAACERMREIALGLEAADARRRVAALNWHRRANDHASVERRDDRSAAADSGPQLLRPASRKQRGRTPAGAVAEALQELA